MAMEEELDEFEVLWPDSDADEPPPMTSPLLVQPIEQPPTPRLRQRCHKTAGSRPVDVPCRAARLQRWDADGDGKEEDGHGSVVGKVVMVIVPPHLLVFGRPRSEEETAPASSPTLPLGPRPCKRARDLRHLRNSVLRMIGFIEG